MEAATATISARTLSGIGRAWAWVRRNALLIFAGFAVLYMLVPILVVALFSFESGNAQGELDFTFDGFSFEYWKDAFGDQAVTDSMPPA